MKRKAESDYRRQLEEERQRAIEASHWVLDEKEKDDRSGLIKSNSSLFMSLCRSFSETTWTATVNTWDNNIPYV